MIRKILVKPWSIDFINKLEYDAFIATVGYEKRARYVAESFAPKGNYKVASAFNENKVLDFNRNLQWYKKAEFETPQHSNEDFNSWSYQIANRLNSGENGNKHVLIDISSMSRYRIASLVYSFASSPGNNTISVDFVYALAKYNPPPKSTGPITRRGPVLPEFAGWFKDPGATSSVLIGIGYDLGKSVSTIEYIEPGQKWVMFPIGEDKQYNRSVDKANKLFLGTLEKERIIYYDVTRAYETFQCLKSQISGILRSSKPVIITLGPKIFTLTSLLVALLEYPKVSIWRVSSGKYEKVANRVASGKVVGLRVDYLAKSSNRDEWVAS